MDEVLDSAEKYYAEVLIPQRDDFFNQQATLRNAFNLASSLFHFHEWLYNYHRSELEREFGMALSSPGAFWGQVEALDPRFGFIRDLANASKHVRLTIRPSTSVTHVAKTSIHVGAFSAAFSKGFDTTRITMKDGAADVPFDDCATVLFDYWKTLLPKLR